MLFDIDGTLVDSNDAHAVTWRNAFRRAGVEVPTWKVHGRIGMSGGLLTEALLSELGAELSPELIERVKTAHSAEYERVVTRWNELGFDGKTLVITAFDDGAPRRDTPLMAVPNPM